MSDNKVADAVDIVARRVTFNTLYSEFANGRDGWEDYPDLGQDDWDDVSVRVMQEAEKINPPEDVFNAAYEYLSGRAEDDE